MESRNGGWRRRLGICCLVYSCLPLLTVELVAFLPLGASQAVLLGAVWLGSGELAFLAALALLGRPFVQEIKARVLGWFKRELRPGPPRPVGRTRHRAGVALFLASFLPYVAAEVLLFSGEPDRQGLRGILYMLLAGDAAFIVSLLMLGDPFWRKLKRLFAWDGETVPAG